MSVKTIDYQRQAEALLKQPEGTLPPEKMLDCLHRFGIWCRGNTHPRGSLTKPAPALLPAELLMRRVLRFIQEDVEEELRRKALLAVGQWGGEESLDQPIQMLESAKTDVETRNYCLSPVRTIGGPRAVAAITRVLRGETEGLLESALNAILDLATGGSASDADSAANAKPVRAADALEPGVADELASTLSELSERKSVAFRLRYRAVDTLEYLKEIGAVSITVPVPVPAPHPTWSERMKAAFDSFCASLVNLDPAREFAGAAGRTAEPGPDAKVCFADLFEARRCVKRNVRLLVRSGGRHTPGPLSSKYASYTERGLAMKLAIHERDFPKGVSQFQLAAVIGNKEFPDPVRSLTRGQPGGTFEFPMAESDFVQWCEDPRFRLRVMGD